MRPLNVSIELSDALILLRAEMALERGALVRLDAVVPQCVRRGEASVTLLTRVHQDLQVHDVHVRQQLCFCGKLGAALLAYLPEANKMDECITYICN